jgi:hypothetical protein
MSRFLDVGGYRIRWLSAWQAALGGRYEHWPEMGRWKWGRVLVTTRRP